jgi:agmatinase
MSDDGDEVTMIDPPATLFGVPRWCPDERYDLVVVGVPSDSGGFGARTPATAPGFLRSLSQLFPARLNGAACVGWFDYARQRTLLEGVRMADAGDFVWNRRRGFEQLAALPSVYATLRASTRLLVILGGDHSIAYWLASSLREEGLVWCDAHEDATDKDAPLPHCGNVVSYIDEMANVPLVAQYGLRGLVPAPRRPPPPTRTLCARPSEVVRALAARKLTRTAVSIDVDVLDPSIMPAVGSPMPGGLAVADLEALLTTLREGGVAVPILELVEFAPVSDGDASAALLLVNFLLNAAAICLDGRTTP